ncbi:hypothetical protein JCM11491_003305 [Sporobolomyces phaffii]
MSKRSAPPRPSGTGGEPPSKRTTTTTTTLNSFFPSTSVPSVPGPIVSSSPVTDRQSTFIAHACPISHPSHAAAFHAHVRNSRASSHPVQCDHEVLAWRTMTLKVGRDGFGGEADWTVKTGGDDDGEKGAAREVHAAITSAAAVDVAVVVSRLYGGILLGPVRFHHIRHVANQALERLAHALAVPPLLARLAELDVEISHFTPPTATATGGGGGRGNEYAGMPVERLERLCLAREKRLDLLQKKFRAEEEALFDQVERQGDAAAAALDDDDDDDGDDDGGDDDEGQDEAERAQADEGGLDDRGEGIDDEEEALWAALEAQAVASSTTTSGGPTGLDELGGLPDEEDAAIAAATLQVERKKRERQELEQGATPGAP